MKIELCLMEFPGIEHVHSAVSAFVNEDSGIQKTYHPSTTYAAGIQSSVTNLTLPKRKTCSPLKMDGFQ